MTLDATLLSNATTRAHALGLRLNIYIGVLVRNDLLNPSLQKVVLAPPATEVRPDRSLSLPANLRRLASYRAEALETNFSRYIEALIERDLDAPDAPLAILAGDLPE